METFNIDEMIAAAKKVVENHVPIKEQCRAKYERIVRGIAKKYSETKNWGIERSDLENVLWIKVFEILESCKNDLSHPHMNENYIAKTCFNRAVDYYRECRYKYWETQCRFDETWIGSENAGATDSSESKHSERSSISATLDRISHVKFENPDETMMIEQVINLFEKGSRERNYIIAKLYAANMILPDSPFMEELIIPEDESEGSYLVAIVNRNGSTNRKVSGGWVVSKWKMEYRIKHYLETGEYDDQFWGDKMEDFIKSQDPMWGYVRIKKVVKSAWYFKKTFNHEEIKQMMLNTNNILLGIDHKGYDIAILYDPKVIADCKSWNFQIFFRKDMPDFE